MNSLVVFLSVVALVAGKPSVLLHGGAVAYSAPVIAAVKAAPGVVLASPAVYSTPALATAAIAPAAVSSQSRIDIKSTPAITSTVVSAAPVAYGASFAYNGPLAYSTPVIAGAVAPAYLSTAFAAPGLTSYAAIPAAAAIGAPAAAAIAAPAAAAIAAPAAPAVPEETPEVIAARAAHFEAKALAEHSIHKRSAPFNHLATPFITSYAATPVVSTLHAAPLAYSAPIAYSSPFITKAYGVHAW